MDDPWGKWTTDEQRQTVIRSLENVINKDFNLAINNLIMTTHKSKSTVLKIWNDFRATGKTTSEACNSNVKKFGKSDYMTVANLTRANLNYSNMKLQNYINIKI